MNETEQAVIAAHTATVEAQEQLAMFEQWLAASKDGRLEAWVQTARRRALECQRAEANLVYGDPYIVAEPVAPLPEEKARQLNHICASGEDVNVLRQEIVTYLREHGHTLYKRCSTPSKPIRDSAAASYTRFFKA
jgi:hypothetical protein